jgi:cytoskeletal protein CcmA (bactofilin family)
MKAKFNSRARTGLVILGIVLTSLLWLTPAALAGEFKGGGNVVIGPREVIEDDLYVGADTITIEGTIKGDLIAGGGEIIINGTVEGDFWAAAGYITINGDLQDDVRIAGGVLTLGPNARIADDVFAAGYSFEAMDGSAIGGSLFCWGYQAQLDGDVKEDLYGGMGALDIAGRIGGNVDVDVGEPDPDFEASQPFFQTWMPAPMMSPGFRVTEGAEIGGKLTYTSGSRGEIESGAEIVGGVAYQTPVPSPVEAKEVRVRVVTPQQAALNWFLDQLRRLVALLLVGLILVLVSPGSVQEAAAILQTKPWGSLGWGVLVVIFVCIAVPLVGFLMIVLDIFFGVLGFGGLVTTVTGLGVLTNVAIIVGFLISAGYISKIVFGFLVGHMILERIQASWGEGRFWPLVIGVVIFAIIRAIPILGWFIGLIVTLLGLGALWLTVWEAYRRRRAASA